MNFEKWVKQTRTEKGLSLANLASRANVMASTINRIENQKAEPLLFTAMAISQGLGVELEEFSTLFLSKTIPSQQTNVKPLWLTNDDVIHLMNIYIHQHPLLVFEFLANGLNQINEKLGENIRFEAMELHAWLYSKSQMYNRLEIAYPPSPDNQTIQHSYERNGVITMEDVGNYIYNIRQQADLTQAQIAGVAGHIIQRIESKAIAKLRLHDAIQLAEALTGGEFIFALAWVASKFDGVVSQNEKITPIIFTLIKMFRWLSHLEMETEYQNHLIAWRKLL